MILLYKVHNEDKFGIIDRHEILCLTNVENKTIIDTVFGDSYYAERGTIKEYNNVQEIIEEQDGRLQGTS